MSSLPPVRSSTLQPFHPYGWDFDQAETTFQRHFGAVIWERYQTEGGTAASLTLCESLSCHDRGFTVPHWQSRRIERGEGPLIIEDRAIGHAFVLRSSSRSGDWRTGEIGVHPTVFHLPGFATLDIDRSPLLHWVEQDLVYGVGVTMDIAWSEYRQSVLLRVATGRVLPSNAQKAVAKFNTPRLMRPDRDRTHQFCTVAAEDEQGFRAAWRLDDGRLIGEPTGGTLANVRIPYIEIARRLMAGFEDFSIDFGVRVELIIDPDSPKMYLIHIRPTPTCVRDKLLAL